ncbi:hypothetical protein GLAREA_10902 [Glarea lozoyensis ATCC 20868]|uniref:Uncharacterized protein n=1 Tax=Glarea lozoyensis (strain ATCC 20868 / MF5171) TaxID=1116229 RepID=S3DBV4_GLAL2|nr:uncharacterized protein GLAREA_10902 [Glarea lozoyensis ATCC 20868]EPE35205.1 hypothetical protein GLAREA_10902 [Glarea lozoyensis ATCC 20868]
MQPVTITLLAVLIPTLLAILLLTSLSVYLYLRLKSVAKVPVADVSHHVEEVVKVLDEPIRQMRELPPVILESVHPTFLGRVLTEHRPFEGDPQIEGDLRGFGVFWVFNFHTFKKPYDYIKNMKWDGAELGQILSDLGYQAMPVASFWRLFEDTRTRRVLLEHLLSQLLFQKTSLDVEPENSFLPLTPVQHRDLASYFSSLEKTRFSPEFATEVGKLPFTIAHADNWPQANYDSVLEKLGKLYLKTLYHTNWELFAQDYLLQLFDQYVYARLRLFAQFQKYEVKFLESSETRFYTTPEVWEYQDDDGQILQEKRVREHAHGYRIDETGDYHRF